jgi:hypothetical protein
MAVIKIFSRRYKMIKNRIFFPLLIAFQLCIFNTIFTNDTLEYQLAVINAGRYLSKDHITVSRFRSLLNQLSYTFVENKQQIMDLSVQAQKLLKEDGIQESLLNIMEGMNQLFSKKIKNQKYLEYATTYITLRCKGYTHRNAIRGIKAILRELGIY